MKIYFYKQIILCVMASILIILVTPVDQQSNDVDLSLDAKALAIGAGYRNNLKWDLGLDSLGKHGSKIIWKSSKPEYISDDGKLLRRSLRGSEKVKVDMTATLSLKGLNRIKKFSIAVAYPEVKGDGYLFTYFEGSGPRASDEQLRFAASADAKNWRALNSNQPVLRSEIISKTGGIRDPHILRAEDHKKGFYIVATDMNTAKNGWDHNPGIVMLKSTDLIDWKHSFVDLEDAYPDRFRDIQWVWAPQTIYDPSEDKYLIYFTVKFKNSASLNFYAGYAKPDFTGFENVPGLMFEPKFGAIDGDIIYDRGTYHFFFKGNTKDTNGREFENGIRKATAKTLRGPWKEEFNYLDAYSAKKIVVEGSSIFKLNNKDEYILMYDLYRNHRYEFQRTKNLVNFDPYPESFVKDFQPRHGSVIGITGPEAQKLNKRWGGVPSSLLK